MLVFSGLFLGEFTEDLSFMQRHSDLEVALQIEVYALVGVC